MTQRDNGTREHHARFREGAMHQMQTVRQIGAKSAGRRSICAAPRRLSQLIFTGTVCDIDAMHDEPPG